MDTQKLKFDKTCAAMPTSSSVSIMIGAILRKSLLRSVKTALCPLYIGFWISWSDSEAKRYEGFREGAAGHLEPPVSPLVTVDG